MSTRIMALCWPLQMRPPAKAVLVSLADMANDEGYCWPTIERLCQRTCFGRTAVIEAIAWLEQCGALRAGRSNGRKTVYWVQPAQFVEGGAVDESPVDNHANQSATRTGSPHGPVRQADPTSRAACTGWIGTWATCSPANSRARYSMPRSRWCTFR